MFHHAGKLYTVHLSLFVFFINLCLFRWNFLEKVVFAAIRRMNRTKTFSSNSLPTDKTHQGQIIIYQDDWELFVGLICEILPQSGLLSEARVQFYVARHGLKSSSLVAVRDFMVETVNMDCDHIVLIQMHLASVLSHPERAVLLFQKSVSRVISGHPSIFRPFLWHKYCHFSNGSGIIGGPVTITSIQAYDMAAHMFRMDTNGMHYIVALLGKKL